jgi:putative acetyltransferase
MTEKVHIRPVTNDDGDAVGDIIHAAFSEYEGCYYDRALEFPELDALADYFRMSGGLCWVASDGGAVVGCCALAPLPGNHERTPAWRQEPVMELKKVYLQRAYRGRGIADMLVNTAIDAARVRGAGIELWTDTRFRAAHRFYARLGFEFTGWTRAIDDISATLEFHYRRPKAVKP